MAKKKESKPAEKDYDRDGEKNQEIGDEFLNPDKDMEQAASTIQGHFRKKQARKKAKTKVEKTQKIENYKA